MQEPQLACGQPQQQCLHKIDLPAAAAAATAAAAVVVVVVGHAAKAISICCSLADAVAALARPAAVVDGRLNCLLQLTGQAAKAYSFDVDVAVLYNQVGVAGPATMLLLSLLRTHLHMPTQLSCDPLSHRQLAHLLAKHPLHCAAAAAVGAQCLSAAAYASTLAACVEATGPKLLL